MFLTYSFLLTAKLSNKTKKPALTIIDYIKARIHGVILSNHSLTYHLGGNLVPRFSQSHPQGWVGENPGTRLLQKFLMCSSYNVQVRLHIVQYSKYFSVSDGSISGPGQFFSTSWSQLVRRLDYTIRSSVASKNQAKLQIRTWQEQQGHNSKGDIC